MADRYVRASGGSDGNDGSTFALGFATLQVAFDAAAGGDNVYICGDFTVTATVDVDRNNGTTTPTYAPETPVYVYGCDASGNVRNGTGKTVITTTTDGLTNGLFYYNGYADYMRFYDLTFDGGGAGKASYGVLDNNATNGGSVRQMYFRCRFTNCVSHGAACALNGNFSEAWKFVDCEADSNGDSGFSGTTGAAGYMVLIGCIAHDNVSHGILLQTAGQAFFCECYDNGADGINISAFCDGYIIAFCTCYGNTSDGIERNASSDAMSIFGCSLVGNGAYGLNFATGDDNDWMLVGWNHFHGNGTAAYNLASGVPPGTNNQSGDPLFTSVTDGSEDFTPTAGSPLLENGLNGMDIGAIQKPEAAASGGGLMLAGDRTGGKY